jgi:hypothetical protein
VVAWDVLQGDGDLDDGGVAEGALGLEGFDEFFEGEILVVVGVEGDGAEALEEVGEGRAVAEVAGEDEGIDEEADEGLGFGVVAVGDEGAEEEVGFAGEALEEGGEGGGEEHEEGGVVELGGGAELVGEEEWEVDGFEGAGVGLSWRAWSVVGEVEEEGEIGEGELEGAEVVVELRGVEGVVLPEGEVWVLDGEVWELGREVEGGGVVEGGELMEEDGEGPAVGDGVMEGEDEVMEVGLEAEEGGAEEWAAGEVEGVVALLVEEGIGVG